MDRSGIHKRKHPLLWVICVVVALSLVGCEVKTEPVVSNEAPEDWIGKSISMIDVSALEEHLKWLSQEDAGRMAGTSGEDRTVSYLEEALASMGYAPEIQSFPFQNFEVKALSLKVQGIQGFDDGQVPSDSVHALQYSVGTPKEGLSGELVDVGMGTEDAFSAQEVKGKFVLIKRGGEYFYIKAMRAYQMGAIGAVFYDPEGDEPVKATLVEPSMVPGISVSTALGLQLTQALAKNDSIQLTLSLDVSMEQVTSENVIATLEAPGDVSKRIVIGAHYDGVDTPAANDNGSGTAALLELAKLALPQKERLTVDISFVFFGAEETGLNGSTYFISTLGGSAFDDIVGMINMDMVGIGTELQLSTINQQDQLPLAINALKVAEALSFPAVSYEMGRSDHVPFAESGIPSVMLAAGPVDNYHTDADTADAIDMNMLKTQIEWVIRILNAPGALGLEQQAAFE